MTADLDLAAVREEMEQARQGAMLETCGSAGKDKGKGCTFPVIES